MRKYAVIVAVFVTVAEISAHGIPQKTVRKPECPLSGNSRLPHPTDCTLYYVCQDGKGTLHECPEGLHFDNAIKQCGWPSAKCIPGINRPETQPNIPEDEKINTSKPTSPTKEKEHSTSNCVGICPIPDPMDRTIQLPYKGDCTRFCTCSNGTPFVMKCPDDLHFDERKSVCNWSWIAKCQW